MSQPNQQQPGNKQGMPNQRDEQKSGQNQQTQQGNRPGSGTYNAPGQHSEKSGQSAPPEKR